MQVRNPASLISFNLPAAKLKGLNEMPRVGFFLLPVISFFTIITNILVEFYNTIGQLSCNLSKKFEKKRKP
ncbi:hypothetical protein D1B31_18575 [Neobacillus notoginsengisoli]|uniref:Uncharacterized protein n=1 Tax=Neobacillus notoginsengisoli TaxID=1578198 RepID=A0A417YQ08_9BACI|nr:hypothetical protein D1B31_18575 [Neobacillus notoginsengisoli]